MIFECEYLNESTAKPDKNHKYPVYVVLMNGKSPLAKVILKVTGDYFSHACISFNSRLSPLYSFAIRSEDQGGGMGFSISKPQDRSCFEKQAYYSVYVTYVTIAELTKMKDTMKGFISKEKDLHYDFTGLVNIAFNKDSETHTDYFCSKFVAEVLSAGMRLSKLPSLHKPQDFANYKEFTLINRGFDFVNYDRKITDRNEKLLREGKFDPNTIFFESAATQIVKDEKGEYKEQLKLSAFTRVTLTDALTRVYSRKVPSLEKISINKNTKGFIWLDNYNDCVVAVVNVNEKDNGEKWIQTFEIFHPYQGKGLSKQILDVVIRELQGQYISVQKSSNVAIKVLKSKGFKQYNSSGDTILMSRDKSVDDEDIDESAIMESSKIPKEIPSEIVSLLKQLNSYDYGFLQNGKATTNMNNFFDNYKSLTISEIEKYKIGVCWDYVHYEAHWFKTHGYKFETFYIQVQDEKNMCPSHTYLVFYLPGSTKVYYFESSWGKYQGIEEFDNINQLHDTIKRRHIEFSKSKCYPNTFFREKYNAESSSWENLSCGEYMSKVSKGRIKVNNESAIEIEGEGGFFDKHNRWNPIVIINNEQYRYRVECLVIRGTRVFLSKNPQTGEYIIPGGGVDKILSNEEQVAKECQEEARMVITNIENTGIMYADRRGVSDKGKKCPPEEQWVGTYNEVYIADYVGHYRGAVEKVDQDPAMMKGRFEDITQVYHKLRPEWQEALAVRFEIEMIEESVKFYKNPRITLKRKNTIKKNSNISVGKNDDVGISAPDNTVKKESSKVPNTDIGRAAEDARKLITSEIFACKDCARAYDNLMCPKDNGFGIIKWNLSKLKDDAERSDFPNCKRAVFDYCKKQFDQTHPNYELLCDDLTQCFWIRPIQ